MERFKDFREAQRVAHTLSRNKGFYEDDEILQDTGFTEEEFMALRRRLILARLAMIGSEVGEAVDAVRASDVNLPAFSVELEDDPRGRLTGTAHGSELADIVIRTMDLAEYMGIDLASEIDAKMARNATRAYKHGKLA